MSPEQTVEQEQLALMRRAVGHLRTIEMVVMLGLLIGVCALAFAVIL